MGNVSDNNFVDLLYLICLDNKLYRAKSFCLHDFNANKYSSNDISLDL